MPITVDALVAGLTAGLKSYDTYTSGWTGPDGMNGTTHSKMLVQIFGTSVVNAQNLHSGNSNTAVAMTTPATTGAAAPNFQVKSYLDGPVVCSVGTTGTATKIAFALVHTSGVSVISATAETAFTGGYGNAATTMPTYLESPGPNSSGDIFMVITLSPGIAVTAGGYLTVKGYTGTEGSKSFTYVTLQSGS